MATTIDGPVGLRNRIQQVTNNASDQQSIAKMLGLISASQGGKREAWAVAPPAPGTDRNCSKPLADAIWDFQTFWRGKEQLVVVDGVVDPGKSSLRKMNELADAAPPLPVPFLQRVQSLIPRAVVRQQSAIAMLGWARIAIDFPDTNDFNKAALGLVDRCFKISQAPGATALARQNQMRLDLAMITQVYMNGVAFLSDPNAKSYFIEISDADIRTKCGGVTANACTNPGHWTNHDPTDGIWVNKEICPPHTDDWLLDAITHEFAHFCGPLPPAEIKDQGYGDAALLLPRERAQKNAANHAWFAGLSQTSPSNWPSGTYPS